MLSVITKYIKIQITGISLKRLKILFVLNICQKYSVGSIRLMKLLHVHVTNAMSISTSKADSKSSKSETSGKHVFCEDLPNCMNGVNTTQQDKFVALSIERNRGKVCKRYSTIQRIWTWYVRRYTTWILDGINSPFPLKEFCNAICSHTPQECESVSCLRLQLNNLKKFRKIDYLKLDLVRFHSKVGHFIRRTVQTE